MKERYRVALVIAVIVLGTMVALFAARAAEGKDTRYDGSSWVRAWSKTDRHISTSLGAAAVIFKVDYRWLKACNNDEAGNNMVYNYQGSGAFGPMQFMPSTFYAREHNRGVYAAWREAKRRGHPIPWRFARIGSRLGQAITAAFMFKMGRSSEWTGAACN